MSGILLGDKPAIKSKTLWFNAICLVLIVLESQLHVLQPFVRPDVYALFCVVLAVGNKVLRLVTVTGIEGFGTDSTDAKES